MRSIAALFTFVFIVACACATPLAAQTTMPAVDPKADSILRKMGQTLQNAKSFSFEVNDFGDEMAGNGQRLQFGKHIKALVRRPDALAVTVDGDLQQMQYAYRGTKLAVFNRGENCYALQDVPNTLDAMFDFLAAKFGITAPISDLCFANPYQAMTENVRSGSYVGLHAVNGVKCHHLAFRQETIDWQIWIDDTDRALPRKIVITLKEQPGHPQYVAMIDKWQLDAPAPDTAFEFTPPAGAKRIDLTPVDSTNAGSKDGAGAGGSNTAPAGGR